jgi:hypothetical protein
MAEGVSGGRRQWRKASVARPQSSVSDRGERDGVEDESPDQHAADCPAEKPERLLFVHDDCFPDVLLERLTAAPRKGSSPAAKFTALEVPW